MAIQETTPPRNILIGYKELAVLACKDSDLSDRGTRIETILEQQRQGTMAPNTP